MRRHAVRHRPELVESKDETDQRRIDKTDDFVAIELAAALAREILVIPVLVDGTHMPKASELPASLKPFALRNAIQVRNTNFHSDAEILIAKICEALGRDRKSGEVISHENYAFSQATDTLIALYRNLERRILDLPFITITPLLIFCGLTLSSICFSMLVFFSSFQPT
jgi:hypothetical protein